MTPTAIGTPTVSRPFHRCQVFHLCRSVYRVSTGVETMIAHSKLQFHGRGPRRYARRLNPAESPMAGRLNRHLAVQFAARLTLGANRGPICEYARPGTALSLKIR